MRLPCLLTALGLLAACPPATLDPIVSAGDGTTAEPGSGTLGVSSATTTAQPTDPGDTAEPITTSATTTTSDLTGTTDVDDLLTCAIAGTCNQLDLLLIVDNSGSMGEEQNNLALQFPLLVQRLRTLKDAQGQGVGHAPRPRPHRPVEHRRPTLPVYESCTPEDKGVLFPSAIYTDLLADSFEAAGKPVFMLLLTGVPSVTAHAPEAPHGPIAGGVLDLVHRQWTPADILPGDPKNAAQKQYEFAIGPGCSNAATGQAIPPGRLQSVCESLNQPGELRCCVESICDPSFAGAIECLADMLAQKLTAD